MRKIMFSSLFLLAISTSIFAKEKDQTIETEYKATNSMEFGAKTVQGEFNDNLIGVIDHENFSTESLKIEISFLDKIQTNEDKDAILYRNK